MLSVFLQVIGRREIEVGVGPGAMSELLPVTFSHLMRDHV
jgi:hypothetical protein